MGNILSIKMLSQKIGGVMKKLFLVMMALTATLILSSCKSIDMSTNQVGWSNYSSLATKDYDIVGIIYLESTETIKTSFLCINTTKTGSRITYSDLMKKAEEMGANDVINVRVDRKTESKSSPLDFITGSNKTYKYLCTATAIRYKEPASSGSSEGNDKVLEKENKEPAVKTIFTSEEY